MKLVGQAADARNGFVDKALNRCRWTVPVGTAILLWWKLAIRPAIVDAVAGRAEVFVDGGIRRGTDLLKALALGARAAMIGRPFLWGLAVNGEDGVRHVLELLHEDLKLSMALAGCQTVANISPALLWSPPRGR
jgi:isopentenyl diphosphate isomerase/L-lactate dehydrogenase-like FMN-dependent dehydrogenase